MSGILNRIAIALFLLLPGFQPTEARAGSPVVFFEIAVSDLAKASSFYGSLFGWTFTPAGPDFLLIHGAGLEGGLVKDTRPASGRPTTRVFLRVEGLAATLKRAEALGASIELPPTQVAPGRYIAEFSDPDGNWIGLSSVDP